MSKKIDSVINATHLLTQQIASLLIYQSVFTDPIGKTFLELLKTLSTNQSNKGLSIRCVQRYSHWFKNLALNNQSWSEYLITQILLNDNPFSQQVQQNGLSNIPSLLMKAAKHDLQIFQKIYHYSTQDLSLWVKTVAKLEYLPLSWELSVENQGENFLLKYENWADALPELATFYQKNGCGIYAKYSAFRWQNNSLIGIANPDLISLESLVGYESQKNLLIKNTEFFLAGYSALNVLLYGSRGSGKSSLVKALLETYKSRGLRLIEVNKSELNNLPNITDQLANSALKFIIFIDDLSFEEDDDAFKALKVVLEGSLNQKPPNVVLYATSNRRHLVREFFTDRPALKDQEEIHSWDTVEEKLSFGDRFGLTLTFSRANQDTYLEIVHHLAAQRGLKIPAEELEFKAKQWATRNNGRSGRTAKQFIDFLEAEINYS